MSRSNGSRNAAMRRTLGRIAVAGTTGNQARDLARSLLRSNNGRRRSTPRAQDSGVWVTEDLPEEGVPSLGELRARVMEENALEHSSVDDSMGEWNPQRQEAIPIWHDNMSATGAAGTSSSNPAPQGRNQGAHWPTALVTLLPCWKDDITVAEGREKWKTFISQFENVINMQPGAFSESQKKILLTVKGGQLIQKLLENLDTASGVDDHNRYSKAKELCGTYFDSNSMKLVDMTTFRNMTQMKDEPFTSYVGRLRSKARVCQFGVEQEAVEIAQQIMNGATDKKEFLSSAVLFPDMKLVDLERLGTRFEMTRSLRVGEAQPTKSGEIKMEVTDYQTVHAVPGRHFERQAKFGSRENINERFQPYGGRARQSDGGQRQGYQEEYLCEQYCGRRHVKGRCPAFGKRCDGCGKTGHFKAVCKSLKTGPAKVKQVEAEVKQDFFEDEN